MTPTQGSVIPFAESHWNRDWNKRASRYSGLKIAILQINGSETSTAPFDILSIILVIISTLLKPYKYT